jgi:hypothetical protein
MIFAIMYIVESPRKARADTKDDAIRKCIETFEADSQELGKPLSSLWSLTEIWLDPSSRPVKSSKMPKKPSYKSYMRRVQKLVLPYLEKQAQLQQAMAGCVFDLLSPPAPKENSVGKHQSSNGLHNNLSSKYKRG